jgi:hypothetical protein
LRTEYVSLIDFSLFKDKWIDFGDSNGQRKGFQLANSDEDARNALQWKNDGSSKAPVIWNAAAKQVIMRKEMKESSPSAIRLSSSAH